MNDNILHFRVFKPRHSFDENVALVFLHGFINSKVWDCLYVKKNFSKKYRCIFIDLLGFGSSPKPEIEYSLENHIDYLKNTMLFIEKHLKKINFIGIGYSAGSLLLLHLSRLFTFKKIVLISFPLVNRNTDSPTFRLFNTLLESAGFEDFYNMSKVLVELFDKKINSISNAFYRRYIEEIKNNDPKVLSNTFNNLVTRIDYKIISEIVENITTPFLCIHADQDEFTSLESIYEIFSKSNLFSLFVFSGNHYLSEANISEISSEIFSFIESEDI